MNKSKLRGIGLQFFAMKTPDIIALERTAIMQRMATATTENNTEAFSQAFGDLAESIQQSVIGNFHEMQSQQDASVLAARGCRSLTSAEQKYYGDVVEAMKSPVPQQALANINTVLPETVIDSVFDDLKDNHPLLAAINFTNTGALVKILLSTTGGVAAWGTIGATITSELSASFTEVDLTLAKLSAFIPINKYMIELGPQWIDRYVRELLSEAMAVQLEVGIANGTGKDQPIGMNRALTGAVDGVYPLKTAIAVADLSPATFGSLLDTLSVGPNSKRRAIQSLLMVVNPTDYFTKVFPATTPRTVDGGYNNDVFPFPTTVIQSAAVTAGTAIFGIADKYFMGIGTQSGGKIEYSDEYKFLEQQRTYLTYMYGYGRALDENAFILADISALQPSVLNVRVTNNGSADAITVNASDARLSSLKIGALTLSPTFNKSVMNYTAATTDATNTITAVAMDGEATITIKNGVTTVANGAAATWATGANTVTVDIAIGGETETYTAVVTKS